MSTILLQEYINKVQDTDKLDMSKFEPVLMGLFGEVGSIMATAKKLQREKRAYLEFQNDAEEEFGDVLWYFNALCRRLKFSLDDIFTEAIDSNDFIKMVAASDINYAPVSYVSYMNSLPSTETALLELGESASNLLKLNNTDQNSKDLLCKFACSYLQAIQATNLSFSIIVNKNLLKVRGRFEEIDYSSLPTFDEKFKEEERIPEKFEIHIIQRKSGKSYLRWNKVFIGEPLTDNILDADDYRFHDVFHFANAAILHWSPVFRGLIKQKRKSDKVIDEVEDGGRASVIEEGISAWLFSHAKSLDYFDNQDTVSFNILKTISQFVRGYEVEKCPLKLWEKTILDGYNVFRKVRDNNGGIVIGDRKSRTIMYKSLTGG